MERPKSLTLVFLAAVCLAVQLPTADAAFVFSGNLYPADPGSWTNSTDGYVGKTADGELEVNGGSDLVSRYAYIGYKDTATGIVTVDAADSTWTNSYELYIGHEGNGTLNITGGAAVSSNRNGYLGYDFGSTGVATVDGADSTWIIRAHSHYLNSGNLYVGNSGSGTINISGGAEVSAGGSTYVANETGSTGLIHFGTGSGTLSTGSLLASPTQLTGTGTINTRGLVSDVDLVLDSTASLNQTLVLNSQPDQNVTVDLDMASDPSGNAALGAGWEGHGSLTIQNGVTVKSKLGYIGYHSGSTGVATVEGAGSTWTDLFRLRVGHSGSGALGISGGAAVSSKYGDIGWNPGSTGAVTIDGFGSKWTTSITVVGVSGSGTLNISGGATVDADFEIGWYPGSTGVATVDGAGSTLSGGHQSRIGVSGSGTLNISGGATVTNHISEIAWNPGSTGVVTVDGAGSMWTNSSYLYVGYAGSGTLHASGGSNVSATSVSINSQSLLAIDVGNGSLLQSDGGSGPITNNGKVRILAGAGATAGGVYEPIGATGWSGSGVYQAVGGTWDDTEHQFTVSGVVAGTSGATVTIDRSSTQRVLIEDGGSSWSVGASFLAAADAASEVRVTGTVVGGSTLAELESLLETGDAVRAAWAFDVTGAYSEGDPAYLSFDLGPRFDRSEVNVWHHDGSQWTEYAAADLTCNGDYASFTVTGFSGYAVSAVPEPSTLIPLDIKPGSWPNSVNPKSKGVLPVAIAGAETFDVTDIDPASVMLSIEGDDDTVSALRWAYEDVATPFSGEPGEGHDLGGDGFDDLTLKFSMQDVVGAFGLDDLTDEMVAFTIYGELTDGTAFEGIDWIRMPGNANGGKSLSGEPAMSLAVPPVVSLTAVPEPGSVSLLVMAAFGFLTYTRRRRKH